MVLLERTLSTLDENLALDEALLRRSEEETAIELLRFWEWPSLGVVLGAGGEVEKDVDVERCRLDGVPIHRRSSGGGTVLVGPGCLLFSLILSVRRAPELAQVNASYRWILDRLARALKPLGEVRHEGICDLTRSDKKFSGNAQQRKQRFLLHHGTLLWNFPLAAISRYLKQPERQPDYRENRPHTEFVSNLPIDGETLKNWLREEWAAAVEEIDLPLTMVAELVAEKYSRGDWINRR